jgi:hypothetical protein
MNLKRQLNLTTRRQFSATPRILGKVKTSRRTGFLNQIEIMDLKTEFSRIKIRVFRSYFMDLTTDFLNQI